VTVRGSFDDLPPDAVYDGVIRRTFSSDHATVTNYTFAPGARFPRHRHAQEQITLVQAGEVEMTIGDRLEHLAAGDWSVVEPGVEHGITAGASGATVVAVVVPRRESVDAYTVVS
jgi:quercetin dioxygenase-like cupin family protein